MDEDESRHVLKVLRHDVGDELPVTDGQGGLYFCTIEATGRNCLLNISRQEYKPEPKHNIHIALAPTKNAERTEWFVEKATEIGVQDITLIQSHRSERMRANVDRLRRVAISAMKQSRNVWLPRVHELIEFKAALKLEADQKFVAYVDPVSPPEHLFQQAKKNRSYLILIGPEGDFSSVEINEAGKAGFVPISLGVNTLRTETAALAACHILNLAQLDLK